MKKIPVSLFLLSLAFVARGAEPDIKPANPPANPAAETAKGKKAARPAKKASTKTQAEIIAAAFPEFDHLPEAILRGVHDFGDGNRHDDIAILAIKARNPGALF